MTGRINLDLGATTEDKECRLAALHQLAALVGAYGRNNVPSASELLRRIADACEFDPQATAALMQQIIYLANAARAVAGETIMEEATMKQYLVRDAHGQLAAGPDWPELVAEGRARMEAEAERQRAEVAALARWDREHVEDELAALEDEYRRKEEE